MKCLVLILSALLSISAFANPDFFVGKYASKKGGGEASISKKLITPANLFEPAVYSYFLELVYEDDQVGISRNLEISNDRKSLSVGFESECEDPGCRYFTGISVLVEKNAKGKAVLTLDYEGFDYLEDSAEVGPEFSKTVIFNKIK